MTLGQLLGLVALIVGFISGLVNKPVLHMDPLAWFVLGIGLVLVLGVGVVPVPWGSRQA